MLLCFNFRTSCFAVALFSYLSTDLVPGRRFDTRFNSNDIIKLFFNIKNELQSCAMKFEINYTNRPIGGGFFRAH
jgi:hypothetical protein